MDNTTCFEVNIKNGVAHLNMNRPDQFNSMTRLFWKELPEIIKEIDKGAKARVILLTGEGKHFSSGMDLGNFSAGTADKDKDPARMREIFYHEVLELQDAFTALEECRMPTIAAIQGACVGGGIDMVAAIPISTSAILKKASEEQYLISQAETISIPPPTHAP